VGTKTTLAKYRTLNPVRVTWACTLLKDSCRGEYDEEEKQEEAEEEEKDGEEEEEK